jgi:hypothetical protein
MKHEKEMAYNYLFKYLKYLNKLHSHNHVIFVNTKPVHGMALLLYERSVRIVNVEALVGDHDIALHRTGSSMTDLPVL